MTADSGPARNLESLQKVPIFADLPDIELEELARNAREIALEERQAHDRSASRDSLYVLVSGEISLSRDGTLKPAIQLTEGAVICAPELVPFLSVAVAAEASIRVVLLEVTWAAVDSLPVSALLLRQRILDEMSRHLLRLHIKCASVFGGLDEEGLLQVAAHGKLVLVERGEIVMRQGGDPDSVYLVISGSLQVFRGGSSQDETGESIDLLQQGECVGEMAVLLQEKRSANVRAHRDSVLLRVSADCFEDLLRSNSGLTLQLARTLGERLKRTTNSATRKIPMKTLALIPCCEPAVFDDFCGRLAEAFEEMGDRIALRRAAPAESGKDIYLDADEASFDYVLSLCDGDFSRNNNPQWTTRSLHQADLVLCVGLLGDQVPAAMPDGLELARKNGARIELALLREHGEQPKGTAGWLRSGEFEAHHHLALGNAADVKRLVRRLTGRAWGLVLSGGGARGFAHIGVIRALRESQIPIDMIAGTSMGAILAAQYAMNPDPIQMLVATRKAYVDGTDWSDYTIPFVSLHTGRGTMTRLKEIFGDIQIEDLSIPYFCISSNLTRATTVVHDRGPVALWARVSCSVPGLLPPMPWNGDLLVDGGLLNNLPVDAMNQRLHGSVVASDVSVAVDLKVDDTLTSETSWSAASQLLRKFSGRPRLPTIKNLLMRSAEVSSVRDSRIAGSPAQLYLDLPVAEYAMTDFDKIDRIVETGYEYTKRRIREFEKGNVEAPRATTA